VTLRTKSRAGQWLAWLIAVVACGVAYALAVGAWGSGEAAAWYAPDQMRFLLPCLIVFGLLAYELRWDGTVQVPPDDFGAASAPEPAEAPAAEKTVASETAKASEPMQEPAPTLGEKAPPPVGLETCEAWERARAIDHAFIPDPELDAEYLKLVHEAAEAGCLPALAKLGEYAWRRGALVEAYFWMALAEKRGLASVWSVLRDIREEWMDQGCPPQYENVYEGFPEERGSIGRALLRIACCIDVSIARTRLRDLAAAGQPDACLISGSRAMPICDTITT